MAFLVLIKNVAFFIVVGVFQNAVRIRLKANAHHCSNEQHHFFNEHECDRGDDGGEGKRRGLSKRGWVNEVGREGVCV